jgi:hypothetical protein
MLSTKHNRVLRNSKESNVRKAFVRTSMIVALTAITAGLASAQATVFLPDTTQSTLLTANVSEQAQVTVPAGVTFNVTNISQATAAAPASVTVNNIVLATASKTLKISVYGAAATFTPSVAATPTWAVADVSWGIATFAPAGTATLGTLALTPVAIVTCGAAVASCSTTNLVFTLAPNVAVTRSGSHTLSMIWKFESI